jgi:PIN domain nuclease of toxin-antitoxin system
MRFLKEHEEEGLGLSIISCWETAKLVELKRLELPTSIEEWLEQALQYPGIHLLDLTPRIAVEATQLPGAFHRDPADQLNSWQPPVSTESSSPRQIARSWNTSA